MSKYEIKNRWTGAVQFECELDASLDDSSASVRLGAAVMIAVKAGANLASASLVGASLVGTNLAGANLANTNLANADLAGVDLVGANLARARLAGANLAGTDLANADLAGATYGEGIPLARKPLYIQGLHWPVLILDRHMQIGCEMHTIAEWAQYDDARIVQMSGKTALKFWREHKAALMALAESHAAKCAQEGAA